MMEYMMLKTLQKIEAGEFDNKITQEAISKPDPFFDTFDVTTASDDDIRAVTRLIDARHKEIDAVRTFPKKYSQEAAKIKTAFRLALEEDFDMREYPRHVQIFEFSWSAVEIFNDTWSSIKLNQTGKVDRDFLKAVVDVYLKDLNLLKEYYSTIERK